LGAKVVRRSADGPAEVRLASNAVQTLEITGIAASPGCLDSAPPAKTSPAQSAPSHYFNVGESGLLARLMIPLSAQLCGEAIINGEGTLTTRSLDLPATLAGATLAGVTLAGATLAGARLAGVTLAGATLAGARLAGVTLAGARLASSETAHPGATSPVANPAATVPISVTGPLTPANSAATVPISVTGPLTPGRIIMDGRHSSQLSSGLIMALPLSARNSSVHIKAPTSIPYLFMTAEVARTFGIKLRSEMYSGNRILEDDWSGCTEIVLKMRENQRYKAATLALEGDWSAAAPFLAYGAIFGAVTLEGLDTTSLQADICFLDILMEAGASISQIDEPRGPISVHKAPLFPFKADLSNSPDLFPVTAVLCAFCQGRSALRGVHRLAHKESDRARAILEMLAKLGVQASIKGDDLFIEGHSLASRHLTSTLLHGGSFTSYSDHRMVMALTLAGFGADAPVVIDDVACVAKSFPDFLEKFYKI